MPLDPNIILAYRPPQVEPAQDQIAKALSIREQQRQEQIGNIALQQSQQDYQDQLTMRGIMAQHPNIDEALPLLAGKVSPKTYFGLQATALDRRAKLTNLAKTEAEVADIDNESLARGAMGIKAAGYSPAATLSFLDTFEKAHSANPTVVQQTRDMRNQIIARQDPAYVKTLVDSWLSGSKVGQEQQKIATEAETSAARKMTAEAAKAREDRAAAQQTFEQATSDLSANPPKSAQEYQDRVGKLPYAVANRIFSTLPPAQYDPDTAVDIIRNQGMTTSQQAQAEARQQEIEGQEAGREETRRYHDALVRQGGARIAQGAQANQIRAAEADPYGLLGVNRNPIGGTAAGGAAAQQLHGEDYLATLPTLLASKARAVMEGRADMPMSRGGVLRGEGKAISDAVYQADPGWTQTRAAIRKKFTTGSDGDNIGALNTATVHLDQLMDAATALNNGIFRPGNAAYNNLRDMFGSSAPTDFETLKTVAAGEAAKALKGTATDPEIAHISANIRSSTSTPVLLHALRELMVTYGAKLNTYQERFRKESPDDVTWTPLLPSASAVFTKNGIRPTAGPGGPGGGAGGGTTAPNPYRTNPYK